jgi:hypothetical protein
MSIIQDLYDNEINFIIEAFWDAGFEVRLGDAKNGFRAHAVLRRWTEVEEWLIEAARVHHPSSPFTDQYKLAPVNLVFRMQVLSQPEFREAGLP